MKGDSNHSSSYWAEAATSLRDGDRPAVNRMIASHLKTFLRPGLSDEEVADICDQATSTVERAIVKAGFDAASMGDKLRQAVNRAFFWRDVAAKLRSDGRTAGKKMMAGYVRSLPLAGLSTQDVDDICDYGITDIEDALAGPDFGAVSAGDKLRRAVERGRKQIIEHRRRFIPHTDDRAPHAGASFESLHAGVVAQTIYAHVPDALDRLHDRYHDVLVIHYDLESEIPLRNPAGRAVDLNPPDHVLRRAKLSFARKLLVLLRIQLEKAHGKDVILKSAILVVEHRLLDDAVEVAHPASVRITP